MQISLQKSQYLLELHSSMNKKATLSLLLGPFGVPTFHGDHSGDFLVGMVVEQLLELSLSKNAISFIDVLEAAENIGCEYSPEAISDLKQAIRAIELS